MNSAGKKHQRFERIREIREVMERKRQKELAEQNETLRKVEARISKLENKKSKFLKQELTDIQGLNAAAILNRYDYCELLSQRISLQNEDSQSTQEAIERARQQLLIATRDRKVLERLCEIYYETEQYESRKGEQVQLDEIASRMRKPDGDQR